MQFAEEHKAHGSSSETYETIKGLEERNNILRDNTQRSPRARSMQPGDTRIYGQ